MKLTLKKYTEDLRKDWDALVENSINGLFLHTRSFFEHNPLNATDDHSYIFYKKNKPAAVIPCTLSRKDNTTILQSHPRSTYGGFVITKEIGVEEAVEMVAKLIEAAKEMNVQEIIIRNPFRIFYSQLSDESDYAMWYHNFSIRSREMEIYIRLDGNITDIKNRYDNGTKYNIKKAYKFIEAKESSAYENFWQILSKNLMVKHGKKPAHSLEQFLQLVKCVGEDKIKFFGGFMNEELVCGCVVFVFGKQALHAQYIAQDDNFQEYRPINAVIDHIIDWGNRAGFNYFNLGTANDEGGKIINTGLFHFKEGFGGRGVLRETMHLILN